MNHTTPKRRRYVPAVGPKLLKLLFVVFALFALLAINSAYLGGVTFFEWLNSATYQDYFYQLMFLVHLALGLLIVVPVIIYGAIHIKNAHDRPNRRAVKVGYALFTTAIILLVSGLVLTRGLPFIEVRNPTGREFAYWSHIATPFVCAWLFVLHRLAGKRINWRTGGMVAAAAALFAIGMLIVHAQDPRQWNVQGPDSGEQYFFPSLARTASGNFIPERTMMMDEYCESCHSDVHEKWSSSVHRLGSFNNPVYLFSVRNTRKFVLERDGNVQAARFCAGCHDPVPFFSGAFDDPDFDDVNHPTAQQGITCTSCHAITHVNSQRGNADYTIEEPIHYPFAFSDKPSLKWINETLVKAKPDFHKKTFLKPLHKTTEFCGGCHKVHLPVELNGYKWLRGQNHYDSFLLSGVSGHGITSFYYPPEAEENCNGCHMPMQASDDFGAIPDAETGELQVHDHQFPSSNTAIPFLLDKPEWVIDAHREFLEGTLRVDLFGLREGGTIEGNLIAPLRPRVPALMPGKSYLVEVVLRTMTMGHVFTQGTADSNEVWIDVTARNSGRVVGRSGSMDETDGSVDAWSHFVNAYVIDRDGNRIERRDPENIFTTLYNHQIPPGAADVIHYRIDVPNDASGTLDVDIALRFRKFDTTLMRHVQGEAFVKNDLPIVTIATDSISFPIANRANGADETGGVDQITPDIPVWQRWNDYGIGLLRKQGPGELRQAEEAFKNVAELGRADGLLNLARVYLREGRLDEAVQMLQRAAEHESPAYPWSVSYFTGIVNMQNGFLDEAIENFSSIVDTRFNEARERNFDFSLDYRLLNQLAQALFERAKLERGAAREAQRNDFLQQAARRFEQALEIDPENAEAHYGLAQTYAQLGDADRAARHRNLHGKYRVDDNARDRSIALARRKSAAADHAADAIVIYDLKPGTAQK